MYRKIEFYEISNENENNIEKTIKRPPNNYEERVKAKDISIDRLEVQRLLMSLTGKINQNEVFTYKIFKFKIKNE